MSKIKLNNNKFLIPRFILSLLFLLSSFLVAQQKIHKENYKNSVEIILGQQKHKIDSLANEIYNLKSENEKILKQAEKSIERANDIVTWGGLSVTILICSYSSWIFRFSNI